MQKQSLLLLSSLASLSIHAMPDFVDHMRGVQERAEARGRVNYIVTAKDCGTLAAQYPLNAAAKARLDKLKGEWAKVQAEYKTQAPNVNPVHLKNSLARRFINKRDWESALGKSGNNTNPQQVYEPSPVTWDNWVQTTYQSVEAAAAKGKMPGRSDVLKWNKGALIGTVDSKIGALKARPNYGKNTKKADALSAEEIASLAELGLEFTPLTCEEDLKDTVTGISAASEECKEMVEKSPKWKSSNGKEIAAQIKDDQISKKNLLKVWYWFDCWPRAKLPGKNEKVCGMVAYPPPNSVESGLDSLLKEAKLLDKCAEQNQPIDTFAYVANFQRRFVALHPFNKGNGRGSRWMMDTLSMQTGLPFLLTDNMNKDLSTPLAKHLDIVERETRSDLARMRDCLKHHKGGGTTDGLCGEWKIQ